MLMTDDKGHGNFLECGGCVAAGKVELAAKGMTVMLKNGRLRIDHDCGLHVAVFNVKLPERPRLARQIEIDLWTDSERTIQQFRNNLKVEQIEIKDEHHRAKAHIFLVNVQQGQRIHMPCKGEISVFRTQLRPQGGA